MDNTAGEIDTMKDFLNFLFIFLGVLLTVGSVFGMAHVETLWQVAAITATMCCGFGIIFAGASNFHDI